MFFIALHQIKNAEMLFLLVDVYFKNNFCLLFSLVFLYLPHVFYIFIVWTFWWFYKFFFIATCALITFLLLLHFWAHRAFNWINTTVIMMVTMLADSCCHFHIQILLLETFIQWRWLNWICNSFKWYYFVFSYV